MSSIYQQIDQSVMLFKANFLPIVMIVASLWVIHGLNRFSGMRLNLLGIHPRRWYGLPGVFFSPFLHKDSQHIFLNSIPLFILLNVVILYGWPIALVVSVIIIVLSGLAIWLLGRPGIHIGASAVVMGYFGFALANAIFTHNFIAILSAALCLFYLGGLLSGLLPSREAVSWEGHLAGFVAGVFCSYYFFS